MDRPRRPPALPEDLADLIRRNLVRCRESAGLTLDQLADRAGITRVGVRKIVYGDNNPSLATLNALAAALGVPLSDLVSVEKKAKRPKK